MKLKIVDQVLNGVRTTGDTFAFAVVLASVSTETTSGTVSYTIEAADKLGHAATAAPGTLKIDAVKPVVSLATDDPAVFGAVDAEGAAGWKIVAADAVGNTVETTGAFNIDGKAPAVAITPSTAWTKGSSVVLDVQVTDGGHGVNEAEVRVTTSGAPGLCPKSGGVYKCSATINTAPGSVNAAYAVTVNAKDKSVNSAQATTTLKVDKKKPTLTIDADGKVYARTGSIVVRATVADADAGLVGSASPAIEVSTGGAAPTVSYEAGTGQITFTILATVAPATAVTSVNVTIHAFDALGNEKIQTKNAQFRVDNLPPVFWNVNVAYPNGPIESKTLLRRDPTNLGRDTATITVNVLDQVGGAGVKNATVFLTHPKKGGGTNSSWPRFQHDNKNTGSLTTPIYTAGVCQD